jgi:dynactin-6
LAAVVVGEGVVVHERARVGIGAGETGASGVHVAGGAEGVRLERYVVVETNAVVEAEVVGEGSEVGVGAIVGRGCVIGKVSASASFAKPGLTICA